MADNGSMEVDGNDGKILGGGKRDRTSLTSIERQKEAGEVVDKAWIRSLIGELEDNIKVHLEPTAELARENQKLI